MTTLKADHRECANCGTHGPVELFVKQVDAEIDWECPKCGMTEEPDLERFETFMRRLAERVGGEIDDVWSTDIGVTVRFNDDLYATFSPGEMGPDDPDDKWVCGVYNDAEDAHTDYRDAESHTTRIPNTSREFDRIATWIEGIKAAIAPLKD